ncbi:hypothetical protein ON010_g10795 [Phytophthora cinnamomi]|nr:hypothetical protein ON010_g10795 [Phytophthora cinnamomi]
MRLLYVALLSAAALLASPDATVAAASQQVVSSRSFGSTKRFLRANSAVVKDNDAKVNTERALAGVGMADLTNWWKGVPGSKLIDKILTKAQNWYFFRKKYTPETLKVKLGLNKVADITTHPNYNVWFAFEKAYNKKRNIAA